METNRNADLKQIFDTVDESHPNDVNKRYYQHRILI